MKGYTYLPVSDSSNTIPLLQEGIINLSKGFPGSEFISENIRVENPHLTIDYFNDVDRDTLESYNKVKNYRSLNRIALSHIYVTKSYITNEIIIALSIGEDDYSLLERFYKRVSSQPKKRDHSLIHKFMKHEMNRDYFLPHATIMKQKLKAGMFGDAHKFFTSFQIELSYLYDEAMSVNFIPPVLGNKLLMETD